MPLSKAIAGVLINVACFAIPLFASAGTLDWWRAWVVVGIAAAGAAWSIAGLARTSPALVEERFKGPIQAGQPPADRVTVLLLIGCFLALQIVAALDVFRFHLLAPPGLVVSTGGLAAFVAGYWIEYRSVRENAFAVTVVRYQQERGQRVIDTGPYAVVRHPMYAGALLFMVGIPLWLQSYAGALVASAIVPICVVRISIEEGLLRRDLAGYEAYALRVRYRLIPYVW
jgi:protein-S-isoprenylcysteine O-methyltransferase Ste14